jgi:D-amino peptidase
MRKFLISADMEGIAAVASQGALFPERWAWEWTAARSWMTGEVSAVAEAAFDAGYDEVIVNDGHGNSHNIDPDRLPHNVRLIRSFPRPFLQVQGIDDPDIDACAFIGYHAGTAAPSGVLAHSFSGAAFRSVRLNGESRSEGYINAALAGYFGKPVILVTGDQHTLFDATGYAPSSAHFQSKETIGFRSQSALPPAQVQAQLREIAKTAFQQPFPAAFRLEPPLYLELEMTSQLAAELLALLPHVQRASAHVIALECQSITDVMQFIVFAMFYTPSGAMPM